MPIRRILVLLLLVILPLAGLAYLGRQVLENEEIRLAGEYRRLLAGRLNDLEQNTATMMDELRRHLAQTLSRIQPDPTTLRQLNRTDPHISMTFMQDSSGILLYPHPAASDLSDREREFVAAFQTFLRQNPLRHAAPPAENGQSNAIEGWLPVFRDEGQQLIFWQRRQDGSYLAVMLNRSRLLADLINSLPNRPLLPPESYRRKSVGPEALELAFSLHDFQGTILYRWGFWDLEKLPPPDAVRSLSMPLASFQLRVVRNPGPTDQSGLAQGLRFQLTLSLLIFGLALSALARWLYRESVRETREARQRVNFVNRVSHELKTPLTNIRLHAELLAEDADETENPAIPRRVSLIVGEVQRLSRLIHNILEFARSERGELQIRPRICIADDVIRTTLDGHRPALTTAGISISENLGSPHEINIDPDGLEQIIGNLLSNAEKYAASGGILQISSRVMDSRLEILVRDGGRGIPAGEIETIFAPFVRLTDSVREGVSGTGIGLAIARDLARAHNGDLTLVWNNGPLAGFDGWDELDTDTGAGFLVSLTTGSGG